MRKDIGIPLAIGGTAGGLLGLGLVLLTDASMDATTTATSTLGAALAAGGYFVWSLRSADVPSEEELDSARRELSERMRLTWIDGDRAPLAASRRLDELIHLQVQGDRRLVHTARVALNGVDTGTTVDLSDTPPEALFNRVNGSSLLVGAPGSGKSLLLWRLLEGLLRSPHGRVPVLIELQRWNAFDSSGDSIPAFEDFLLEELCAPAIGLPRNIARRLLPELTLLLDGLDETGPAKADRCLQSLERYTGWLQRDRPAEVILTCRSEEYDDLVAGRGGLAAKVTENGIRIEPLSGQYVLTSLRSEGARFERALLDIAQRPSLHSLLRAPLWYSVARTVYSAMPDPLKDVPDDANEKELGDVLYSGWARLVLGDDLEECVPRLGFVARTMHRTDENIFYPDSISPAWLPRSAERTARLFMAVLYAGVAAAVFSGVDDWRDTAIIAGLGFAVGLAYSHGVRITGHMKIDFRGAWRRGSLRGSLARGIAFGAVFVLFAGLIGLAVGVVIGVLWRLLDGAVVQTPLVYGRASRPYDGLRRAVILQMVRGLPIVLIAVPLGLYLVGVRFGVLMFMAILMAGMAGIVSHVVARTVLAFKNYLPWGVDRFLRAMSTSGLMYPVGAGYRFRHRTLMAYFAQLKP